MVPSKERKKMLSSRLLKNSSCAERSGNGIEWERRKKRSGEWEERRRYTRVIERDRKKGEKEGEGVVLKKSG